MTDTTRADDAGSVTSGVLPGIGTLLAGITMIAMFVPVRRGVDDPVVLAGFGFAIFAGLTFFARRHGGLQGRIAGLIVAGSSVSVVLLTGYALNQGVTASAVVSSISLSVPFLFIAFVTAGLTAAVGVAEYVEIGVSGLKRRMQQVLVLTAVGISGLYISRLTGTILAIPVLPFIESLSEFELLVVNQIVGQTGMALGTVIIVALFLTLTDRDRSFIDLRWPSLRDLGWIVGGLVVLFGALFAITLLMQSTGVESAEHSTTQLAQEYPNLMLLLVPFAVLIIGPFEELLYRNVIQKSLYETFSRLGAIVVASIIFASVHAMAYNTAALGVVIASLATVFGLSIVLGVVYERTDNLLVPALIHGVYNALLFANLYFVHG